MVEGKAKYNFDNNTSIQLRARGYEDAAQLRLTVGYKENIGKNTSVYVNPYVAEKFNYNTGESTTDVGIFGGVTRKIGENCSISLEAQRYKLNAPSPKWQNNWGVNAMVTYSF